MTSLARQPAVFGCCRGQDIPFRLKLRPTMEASELNAGWPFVQLQGEQLTLYRQGARCVDRRHAEEQVITDSAAIYPRAQSAATI